MVNQTGIQLGKIAVFVDPSEIIPSGVSAPTEEVEIGLVKTPVAPPPAPPAPIPSGLIIPFVPVAVDDKKSLIVNIETTGYDPLKHRIIAIGLQDPMVPNEPPVVIMLPDEAMMISQLFSFMKDGGYNEMVGYGLGFELKFLFIKALKFNMDCRQFYEMDLFDTMQSAAQMKQSFVYKPQQPPKLSDLADYLWGYPKPFTDLEMMKYYAQGRFDKVVEFTSSQITRILALYLLVRKVTENPFMLTSLGIESESSKTAEPPNPSISSKLTIPEASMPETWTAKCDLCLGEFPVPITQNEFPCPVDSTIIKREGG